MSTRERLVEAGLRLLDEQGPDSLNARKLAASIEASTMTVYTHFGGMAGLYEALVRESFVRFGDTLSTVEATDDPIADLFVLGLAYRDFALASPQRYRFMFGVATPGSGIVLPLDLTTESTPTGITEASATFDQLVEAVGRSLAADRIHGDDPVGIAAQFWSTIHGFVLLESSGFLGTEGQGVGKVLAPLAVNLTIGLGDDPMRTAGSMESAMARWGDLATPARSDPGTSGGDVRRGRRPRAGGR